MTTTNAAAGVVVQDHLQRRILKGIKEGKYLYESYVECKLVLAANGR